VQGALGCVKLLLFLGELGNTSSIFNTVLIFLNKLGINFEREKNILPQIVVLKNVLVERTLLFISYGK
jgi:hypothetical protein